MQLVGATKGFIRRPFIFQNLKLGFLSSLLALALLSALLYYLQQNFPILSDIQDLKFYAMLYAGVIVLGLLISWVSTFFAMNKYLGLKTEELYY